MTDMLKELADVVREWESVEGHEAMVLEKMHMLSAAGDFIRTHHAEIAQNAEAMEMASGLSADLTAMGQRAENAEKRLRALEMAMDETQKDWDACGQPSPASIRQRADEIMRGES